MLRQIAILLLIWASAWALHAQSSTYAAVDTYALNAPKEACENLNTLAYYLRGSGKFTESEKARAIYTWVTHNIIYNHSIIEQNLLGNTLMQQAENVLIQRSGVCEGYANLYKALANTNGLNAEIVTGKVRREDGQIPEIGHAWVAIKLNGAWFLSDPTWGAGYFDPEAGIHYPPADDQYFLVDPAAMIKDHYPFDPIWQLNRFPMTQAQWENWDLETPAPKNASTLPFFFADSIAYLNRLDTLQRTLNTCSRILRFNPNDDYALTQLGLKMYEQGLVALVNIYENLFVLEGSANAPIDTSRYTRQLPIIQQYFSQAWFYLQAVKNEKLRVVQRQVQALEYMQAELVFVQGHIHYTLLSRYSRENLSQLNNSVAQSMLRRIQQECELASASYSRALDTYAQDSTAEIKQKRAEIIFFWARSMYLSAISHLNASANRSKVGEEALSTNLAWILQGKSNLLAMKKALDVSKKLAVEIDGLSELTKDYPLLMAKLLANESLTRYDLISQKYRLVFDNPLPFLSGNFSTALEGYREGARRAEEGLKILSSSHSSERPAIAQFLNAGGGLANVQIGAYQAQVAYKLHEKLVKNPSIGPKDKAEALQRIQQAKAAFGKAKPFLEQSGSGSNQLLNDLISRESRLEELKRWWDLR